MGSGMDGSQPLPQGQRRQGQPVPAPVEAVVHFGYPPDLVSSTYQQLLSTSGSPSDVIHTTGNDATGSRTAENGYVSAALLLVSVEANINFASSSLQSRHEPDLISLPTASEGTLTRCQNADDLEGDGGSGDGSDETSSRSSSPRRHQNVIRDHESNSPASSLDPSTPSTPTMTEPTQWTSSAAPAAAGTSATGNTTIPTMPSTGVSASVSSAETSTVTTAPSAANDHSEVSSSSETPTTTTTTITIGDAVSSGDAAGSQHRDLDGTTLTAFQVTATSTTTSTATSTTTSSHVVQTPADDKARERRRQLERLRALRAENRRLKARSLCRQCRSRPVALTFLPCGHFLFCQECGSSFSACPVCKKTILADVRTFVS